MTRQRTFKMKTGIHSPWVLFITCLAFVAVSASQAPQVATSQPISPPSSKSATARLLLAPDLQSPSVTNAVGEISTFLAPNSANSLFQPVVTYSLAARGAWAIAVGDLNGDGYPDLVVTSFSVVGVLLGKGDGTFRPVVSYSIHGDGAIGVVVADVNDDGKLDILVASAFGGLNGDGAAAVLLGNGDGTFKPEVDYDAGGPWTYSIAVGDFNGDGKVDLVVADCSPVTGAPCGLFGILLGNGDGTFQPVKTYNSGGIGAWSVTVSDLNGDGKADVVIANLCADLTCAGNGLVAVLLGNGDGTFQSPKTFGSGGRTLVPVVADVNGDGKADIVVANGEGTAGVGVLLGNGDGTFQTVVTYAVGEKFVSALAVADVDADGKLDVVVSDCASGQLTCGTNASVGVLLGNGNGSFQPAMTYASGGVDSIGIALGDVNGDNRPDILVANNAPSEGGRNGSENGVVGVLLNTPGTPTATTLVSSLNPSLVGQAVTFTATVRSSAGSPPNGETITFKKGSSVLGTSPLSGGMAALTTSSLAAGIYTITATYPGDDNFAASTSPGLRQVVNSTTKSATSTTLASSLNPSIYGQSVTWTATVTTSGSVPPTGKVTFTWGYVIGTATLNSSGVATLTKSNLNADTYPLTAVYVGDTSNAGSTSTVVSQLVSQAASSATLTSSPNPSTSGQAVTFTATITSPTAKPTGPVTFAVGKTVLGTGQLSSGKAKFTTSTLAVGSIKVTATYSGNSNIATSSASVTQIVQQ
jgi:hypothetical protein